MASEATTAKDLNQSAKPKSLLRAESSKAEPANALKVRYNVALLMTVTMGAIVLISHHLLASDSSVACLFGALIAVFISSFGYEWCWVHAGALTRHRRAYFDEVNILETYQPRARTMGHLFNPDPPTPGPVVKIQEGDAPERSPAEKAAFNATRDSHYANMFQHAMQVAKEQEAMEKASAAKQQEDEAGSAKKEVSGRSGRSKTKKKSSSSPRPNLDPEEPKNPPPDPQ